jgi:hypothetical protein
VTPTQQWVQEPPAQEWVQKLTRKQKAAFAELDAARRIFVFAESLRNRIQPLYQKARCEYENAWITAEEFGRVRALYRDARREYERVRKYVDRCEAVVRKR